ncbi:Dipeptidyl aminopeptidase/acylaminoacyl peptidase [Bryocella elongata]|uniref:Dipeptidyl aminopeptidase/acylaminoacyl peptidase n=1 Tax=Bryocella elongata TaxID=863522 RepID=A0A1H6C9C2_9BACT|nr:S9 family peptidase [Bryocella elongata]SEG69502.1 Dipeptidyl aminopeptidase/acylaminoacyl peptidase [Bryocella elongata]
MMRRLLAPSLLLALAFVPSSTSIASAQAPKRPITEKDIFDFVWIGDTQLSPKDGRVVFVQTTVSADRSGYDTALYLLDTATPGAKPERLTAGPREASPRWSPDGTQIAFIRSAANAAGKPTPQLYVMPAKVNSTITKVTDLPRGAGNPQWSPNGQALTVTSSTPQDPAEAKAEAQKRSHLTGDDAHVSDIKVINRATWRANGEGYLEPEFVPQLYMVWLPKADGSQAPAWQLTGGRFGVQDALWSPDSKWIFYAQSRIDEPIYEAKPHNTIYGIKVSTGPDHAKEIPSDSFTDPLKVNARGLSLSPDGKHLAFHASAPELKPATHKQDDLWIMDLGWVDGTPSATEPRDLTSKEAYEMGGSVGGDNTAPKGGGRGGVAWTPDSSAILDIAGYRGSALLVSVDTASGKVTELSERKQAVLSFNATADAKTVIAQISNPILIGDLFALHPGDGKSQTQLTKVNDALFSQLDIAMPLDWQVKPTHHAEDIKGETIDTFVMMPPGITGKPAKPLPLILNIHGGPHSAYGWVFDHEMLWMAARGYVVVYPNPRGSTTYGENFANIILNNYPGDDFHDLMDTVDEAVKLGYADPARLGVTGGSGGGLLTDWVVTQTDRFKAAVAQRDITDWANWWYTADMAGFHQSFYPTSPPWEHIDAFRAHSPITYVDKLKTPMLFILGDADFRTPTGSGGEEFFRALKYKKIPTVMVRFPRESHELSRSGEPWHRVERLENIVNWMDRFLMDKCEPQYDITPTCKP